MVTSVCAPADIGGITLGDAVKENKALASRIDTSVSATRSDSSITSMKLCPAVKPLVGICTVPDQPPELSKTGEPEGVITMSPAVPKIFTATA